MRNTALLSVIVLALIDGLCPAHSATCTPDSRTVECLLQYGKNLPDGHFKLPQESGTVTGVQSGVVDKTLQKYVVFIHASRKDKDLGDKVSKALTEKTYNVKGPDDLISPGGAAVAYFRDDDRVGAEAIAAVVNGLRPNMEKITAQKQSADNPSGYIGVWLSSNVSGWYYLGKLTKDKKSWTPDSSANGSDLKFSPQLAANQEIPAQIKSAIGSGLTVSSSNPKYLRADDPKTRVKADVETTLEADVKVRIVELDDTAHDNGYPVIWGKVEVVKIEPAK